MRKLAERIMEAISKADNTYYDEVEAVEEILQDWQNEQTKQHNWPEETVSSVRNIA